MMILASSGRRPRVILLRKLRRREDPRAIPPPVPGSGEIVESWRPTITAGTAKTSPARGPAAATSNKERRSRGADFILMNAPKVPIMKGIGGAGMK
jgi:hypothetical protein